MQEIVDKDIKRCLEIAVPRLYKNLEDNCKKIRSLRQRGRAEQAIKKIDDLVFDTDQTTEEGYCSRFYFLGYIDEEDRKTLNRQQQNKFVLEMGILYNEHYLKELPSKEELALQSLKRYVRVWLKR